METMLNVLTVKKNHLKNQSGFSLVELMVVVAIIGILASMSVGQVQKQIAKARQSEVKTNLASLFTAEKTFNAEFNTFCSDFGAIGFDIGGQVRYNIGFSADHRTAATANGFGYTGAGNSTYDLKGYCASTTPGPCLVMADASSITLSGTSVNQSDFKASGGSAIYKGYPDIWHIDDKKFLTNTTAGIY